MSFNSFNFWLVFPFIFTLYWLIPYKYLQVKKWVLILVSYLLYINWNPVCSVVLIGVTFLTYFGALIISEKIKKYSSINAKIKKKRLCIFFVILAILPLLLFKYYNFINDIISEILSFCGLNFFLPGLNWAIPVGISFYTFQALGYFLDVYYDKILPERSFTDYVLFCSFFPQTASGPISRYSELMPQIKYPHPFNYAQGVDGLKVLLWGMFLKVVMADTLGLYVDTVYANYNHYSGLTCFIASTFYTIQIYGDFAGYSLMAVGIGKLLGFELVNNFQRPYFATSITDFWKRWHISLTRWFTTYVYILLGGNRCSPIRHYLNIMITFLISGLWHGANFTFLVWGTIHGVLQVLEKIFGLNPKGKYNSALDNIIILKPIRIVITFAMISFAWIFFRMPTLDDAFTVIWKILTNCDGMKQGIPNKPVLAVIFALAIGKELVEEYFPERKYFMDSKYIVVRWATYLFLFTLLILYGVLDSSQFIYVSF